MILSQWPIWQKLWNFRSLISAKRWVYSVSVVLALCVCTNLAYGKGVAQVESLGTISVAELPKQGQHVHALIAQGGPFPYDKDGVVFGNRERQLPAFKRGYYREYTVKTTGVRHRGAKRIVCGGLQVQLPDACYYTEDHYASFRKIVR
jgi:ribonuclease T1